MDRMILHVMLIVKNKKQREEVVIDKSEGIM